jgi:hypothetical protein
MADYGYGNTGGSGLREALNQMYPMTGLGEWGAMFPPNSGSPTPEAPVPIPRQRPPIPRPPVNQNNLPTQQNLNVPLDGTPAYQAPIAPPGPGTPGPALPAPGQLAPAGGPVPLPPGGVTLPPNYGAARAMAQRLRGFNPAAAAQALQRF